MDVNQTWLSIDGVVYGAQPDQRGPVGGGHEYYCRFPTQSGIVTDEDGLEVDNCEISGFGLAGVMQNRGRDHYIRHCQCQGLGYGVTHGSASSLIERDLFD